MIRYRVASTLLIVTLLAQTMARAAAPLEDVTPPVITFIPCEAFQRDKSFNVFARFDDASAVFEPKLMYRVGSDPHWRNVPFKPQADGLFKATIPKSEMTGALAYFVEAFDENGNGPARVGSPDQPLFARKANKAPECQQPGKPTLAIVAPVEEVAPIEAPPPTVTATSPPPGRCDGDPFYCKTWFWVATGGVILLGVGIAAAVSSGGSDRGYPERVTLVVQPAAALETR